MWPFIIMSTPQQNSGAFFGFNYGPGWAAHSKSYYNNNDNGSFGGYISSANINGLWDNDAIDVSNTNTENVPTI